jgi:hypothetical protein
MTSNDRLDIRATASVITLLPLGPPMERSTTSVDSLSELKFRATVSR